MSSTITLPEDFSRISGLLEGQVAVVTGAGRGNGAAIATGLARAGALVCCADVDGDAARETAARINADGGQAMGVTWNIADRASGEAALAEVHAFAPQVSILVNNAGVEAGSRLGEPEFDTGWQRVMDVNLRGTMLCVEFLLPDLRATRGSIINVASIQSFIAYQAGTSAYAASKAALAQLTRSLAVDLATDGVRVNAIAPGFIETAMTAGTRGDPERLAKFRARTPLQRMGQPAELAGPVVFLASTLASYITGAVLPVDGGLLAM